MNFTPLPVWSRMSARVCLLSTLVLFTAPPAPAQDNGNTFRRNVVLLSVDRANARVAFGGREGDPGGSLPVPSASVLERLLKVRAGTRVLLVCQRDDEGRVVVSDVKKYRSRRYWLGALLGAVMVIYVVTVGTIYLAG